MKTEENSLAGLLEHMDPQVRCTKTEDQIITREGTGMMNMGLA